MTNIELMEKALPTAPLKIAALESCKDLAEKVDQYIVSFRKNSLHDFLDPAIYSSYEADSYLAKNSCPRFGSLVLAAFVKEWHNYIYTVCLSCRTGSESRQRPSDDHQPG